MPDYVYALHDFLPENEDEISFHQGDRIEVIERDDVYGDGWWQGRNLDGKAGLFPQSYTSPAPPVDPIASSTSIDSHDSSASQRSNPLQPLQEADSATTNGIHPISNGHGRELSQGDGEVMKATMTDVQKAIEQLGRNNDSSVRDDARSFSFASSRTGDGDLTDHETDTDIEIETDRETGTGGEDWHRGARIKLAEQARKVVEEEKKQQEQDELPVIRNIAPPIEVEMSDESEGEDEEDGHHRHPRSARTHPHIPEEEEEGEGRLTRAGAQHHEITTDGIDLPTPDDTQLPTATHTTFPSILPVAGISPDYADAISATSLPTPTSPSGMARVIHPPEPSRPYSVTRSQATTTTESNIRDPFVALPSPVPSSVGHAQYASKHSSLASSAPTSSSLQPLSEQAPARENSTLKKSTTHPSEWTVEEVIDWLKLKGFEDVSDKFIEQEITGDVLLDLDVNLLKTEIGILAFGKRARIANAITELRRPPSVVYSDHTPAQSQSTSQPPTYGYSHSHSQSFQSSGQVSLHSPMYPVGFSPTGPPSTGYGMVMSPIAMTPESPTRPGDTVDSHQRRVSDPVSSASLSVNVTDTDDGTNGIKGAMERSAMLGLGLGVPSAVNGQRYRPAQLMLSPSDSNLGSKTRAVAGDIPQEADEERAFMSENDAAPSINKRRRMFGRSVESGSSTKRHSLVSKNSNEPNSPLSAQHLGAQEPHDGANVVSRHSRGKRSVDGNKASDRLSLFGNPFNASIGKTRKPAPRYSSYVENPDTLSEKPSTMNLSRLYGGASRKVSGRPRTADGPSSPATSPKKAKAKDDKREWERREDMEKESKDPAVLRKRTMSTPHDNSQPRGMQALKPGQSFFEQIGEPDHSGWMRKKGDRYNSWKSRYFVLKGSDLYILKSADKSQTKIKGYINIVGYKVLADENTDPGRYGFRIMHDTDKTHFFSSAEQNVIREWMKAIMKSTIDRDYSKAVISSCNIPTIPLTVAQAMSPAPRPPSPTARAAAQKAHRQENPHQLTSRDVRVLMGLPGSEGAAGNGESAQLDQFLDNRLPQDDYRARTNFGPVSPKTPRNAAPPPRPSREMRSSMISELVGNPDADLIEWANSHLPKSLQIIDPLGSLCGGLALLRLAESIKGKPSSPPVPDSAFPSGPNDDRLDGFFRLFDFLLDNDVKTGSVSINEVRQGKRDKIVQLLKALKAWDDKRKAIADLAKGGHNPALSPYGMLWGQM